MLRIIRVLLLIQRAEAWVNIASIWATLRSRAGFEPHVLALPYNFEDAATSSRMAPKLRSMLQALGVPFEEWHEGWRVEDGRFDAVIINHPYDRERPGSLCFKKLAAAIPVTFYVPYGPVMAGGYKNLRLQFAQPTQIGAAAIVARSEWEKRMYALHCPSGDSHVYVLGHPRFDQVGSQQSVTVPAAMRAVIGNRMTVLWNSHFSFPASYSQSSNFSTFDLIGPELFAFAKKRRDKLCLLWRPHPGLFPVILREGFLTSREIDPMRAELAQIGVLLDESTSHLPAFQASDALVTDVGSFLLEYLTTGKPILALINPDGEPLNEESRSLVRHYPCASDADAVLKFIDGLATGEPDLSDLSSALEEHLPCLDGRAGERVVNLLEKLVASPEDQSFFDDGIQYRPPAYSSRWIEGWNQESSGGTEDIETPTLDKLTTALRRLRAQKAREPQWRKGLRRVSNAARTGLGEAVKRHPTLVRLSRSARRSRANEPNDANAKQP